MFENLESKGCGGGLLNYINKIKVKVSAFGREKAWPVWEDKILLSFFVVTDIQLFALGIFPDPEFVKFCSCFENEEVSSAVASHC